MGEARGRHRSRSAVAAFAKQFQVARTLVGIRAKPDRTRPQ
jgi:hypothetical protein